MLRSLLARAAESRRAVTLRVLHSNPRALALYEAYGFARTRQSGTHVFMRLEPSAADRIGVRLLSQVTEAEVIASFLRAELASDRWRDLLLGYLETDGRDASVVTEPRLDDPGENAYREQLLELHRGWLSREGLFLGFPHGIDWFLAALSRERVLSVLYINWDWWLEISGGTRSPIEAARRTRDGEIPGRDSTAEWHEPIAARLRGDDPPPELVVVSLPDVSKLVLVEGHIRLTAYALFPHYLPEWLEIFLGVSDEIESWCQF